MHLQRNKKGGSRDIYESLVNTSACYKTAREVPMTVFSPRSVLEGV